MRCFNCTDHYTGNVDPDRLCPKCRAEKDGADTPVPAPVELPAPVITEPTEAGVTDGTE